MRLSIVINSSSGVDLLSVVIIAIIFIPYYALIPIAVCSTNALKTTEWFEQPTVLIPPEGRSYLPPVDPSSSWFPDVHLQSLPVGYYHTSAHPSSFVKMPLARLLQVPIYLTLHHFLKSRPSFPGSSFRPVQLSGSRQCSGFIRHLWWRWHGGASEYPKSTQCFVVVIAWKLKKRAQIQLIHPTSALILQYCCQSAIIQSKSYPGSSP